jgi:uncharacterized membrane protein YgdD (TMEM256/DUF423 family)
VRRAFVSPKLQTIVLTALLVGLTVSSVGILAQSDVVFRFGWTIWMTGIVVFIGSIWKLGREVRKAL